MEKITLTKEMVLQTLQNNFGNIFSNIEEPYGILTATVTKDKIIDILAFLNKHEILQFQMLTDLCAVHFPERDKKFQIVYHVHSLSNNFRLRLKVDLDGDPPKIPTATIVYATANWMERETYDFYGVIFEGHPNLKRILNIDDMVIFPMRKEYPLEDNTRTDKDDRMFGREPNPLFKPLI